MSDIAEIWQDVVCLLKEGSRQIAGSQQVLSETQPAVDGLATRRSHA